MPNRSPSTVSAVLSLPNDPAQKSEADGRDKNETLESCTPSTRLSLLVRPTIARAFVLALFFFHMLYEVYYKN